MPTDVVIVMDTSSSLSADGYYKLQNFAKNIANGLNLEAGTTRIGYETYATDTYMNFNLDQYSSRNDVIDAISYPQADGATNTASGLSMMMNNMFTKGSGMRNGTRRMGIVISDGRSSDAAATLQMAAETHESGITVLGVGVNVQGYYAQMEMKGMTTDPDDSNYFEAQNYDSVQEMTGTLVQLICEGKGSHHT